MLKTRVIACVLYRDGVVVQSKAFSRYQVLGDPVTIVERLSGWACDELIYLDISRCRQPAGGRCDLGRRVAGSFHRVLGAVSRFAFMPLTVGGHIRSVKGAVERIESGADKVALNTAAVRDPRLVGQLARVLGGQCVVVSVDVRREGDDWRVFADGGRVAADGGVVTFCRRIEDHGAGEILLHAIDRDGAGTGYDLKLLETVAAAVSIPVVALGGVGAWSHMDEALRRVPVSGVAAANIFHYTENSMHNAKRYLYERGHNVRAPDLLDLDQLGGERLCAIASGASTPKSPST